MIWLFKSIQKRIYSRDSLFFGPLWCHAPVLIGLLNFVIFFQMDINIEVGLKKSTEIDPRKSAVDGKAHDELLHDKDKAVAFAAAAGLAGGAASYQIYETWRPRTWDPLRGTLR